MFVIPNKLLLGFLKKNPRSSIEEINTFISSTKYRQDAVSRVLQNCQGHGHLLPDFLGRKTVTYHRSRIDNKKVYIGCLNHSYTKIQDFFIDFYNSINWDGYFYMLNWGRFVCEFNLTEDVKKKLLMHDINIEA